MRIKNLTKAIILSLISTATFAQNGIGDNPTNFIFKERPADFEYLSAPDSLGIRHFLKTSYNISNNRTEAIGIKLPYPIIFIHGLNSNSATWLPMTDFLTSQYGLSNGGNFDYSLNYDGNNTTANKDFYPTLGADIALWTDVQKNIGIGDFYYLNFDVGSDGSYSPSRLSSTYVLSNQSAITKQGAALASAIEIVLQKTGKDKVILMGHSMGGLASREYLQNWTQRDGKHHVAKLVTTGTPHGGSNATSFGIISSNTDGQSEAIRDLRRTYYYSPYNPGVYLFGGTESKVYMKDQLCCDFYNSDVNCNGVPSENIVGLNNKNIPSDLDYSCIIGNCTGCIGTTNAGDGVVTSVSANLNNYYSNITKNLFNYNAIAAVEIHTDMPKQTYQNMQGLDEPNEYSWAYDIDFDITYTGFTTMQPVGGYGRDYDDFKFKVTTPSNVNISISGFLSSSDLSVYILNSNYQRVDSAFHPIGSTTGISFTSKLTTGNYYLEIVATPTATSYLSPYKLTLSQNPIVTSVDNSIVQHNLFIYPNPSQNFINVEFKGNSTLKIHSLQGTEIANYQFNNTMIVDVSNYSKGLYVFEVQNGNSVQRKTVIVQ